MKILMVQTGGTIDMIIPKTTNNGWRSKLTNWHSKELEKLNPVRMVSAMKKRQPRDYGLDRE
jgi:hypothetical protein